MSFACWHECTRCGKGWCHSIANPCVELDGYFSPCPGCPSTVKQQSRKRLEPDGEDGIAVGQLVGSIGCLYPDEIPDIDTELPEFKEM